MTSRSGRRNPLPRTVGAGAARGRPGPRRRRGALGLCALALVVAWSIVACSGDFRGARGTATAPAVPRSKQPPPGPGAPVLEARDDPLPVVTPTPREMRWLGPDVTVPSDVDVIVADDVEPATTDTVTEVLRGRRGAERTRAAARRPGPRPGAARRRRRGHRRRAHRVTPPRRGARGTRRLAGRGLRPGGVHP